MNRTNFLKYTSFFGVIYFICIMLWAIFTCVQCYVNAAHIVTAIDSTYVVRDDDDKVVLRATMNNGSLKMIAYNHKATTTIRWCTVGFYITTAKVEPNDSKEKLQENMIGATFLYSANDCSDTTVPYGSTQTKSTYYFSDESVKKRLSDIQSTLDTLDHELVLYLQPIFKTYTWTGYDEDGRPIGTDRKTNLYRLSDIQNAEGWGSDTMDDFEKYYNIPLPFAPGEQNVVIDHIYTDLDDETWVENEVNTTGFINDSMDTYNTDIELAITKDGTKHYYQFVKAIPYTYAADEDNEKNLQNYSATAYSNYELEKDDEKVTINAIIPYCGLHIRLYYKEVDPKVPVTYIREIGHYDSSNEWICEKEVNSGTWGDYDVGEIFQKTIKKQYFWDGETGEETQNQIGENIYDLVGYYVHDGNDVICEVNPHKIEDEVLEDGLEIHLLYVQNEDYGRVTYVREWEDGTQFDSGTYDGTFEVGDIYSWSVKKKVYQTTTGVWKERASGTGSSFYDLVDTYILDAIGHRTADSPDITGSSIYEGDVEVLAGGVVIHYVYGGDPPEDSSEDEEVTPTPTPVPTIPDPVVPEAAVVSKDMNTPTVVGSIRADDRGTEKFVVESGIATTESLFVQVQGTKYLLGYTLTKKVGIQTYTIPVSKTYTLIWQNAIDEDEYITETYTANTTVMIKRAYGYWEITNIDYYTINGTKVNNYALPDGTVTISSNDSENPIPMLTYTHSSTLTDHVLSLYDGTLELPAETLYGGTAKPNVDINIDLYTYEANSLLPEATVKNDYLSFGGNVVMSSENMLYDTGGINESAIYQTNALCNENVLYSNDNIIESTKLNGTYSSSGTITYRPYVTLNSKYSGNLTYMVEGLNNVTLHTPVLCNPIVSADNDKYVQLISPTDDCIELVLDEDATLNDFTLQISNYGLHAYKQGYYTRDFSYNLYDGPTTSNQLNSYIQTKNGVLRNEVKFPFDVYMYQSDGSEKYIAKNTWVVIGRSTVRFHLPMWVDEGVYTVDCRTVAVNCTDGLITSTEYFRNSSLYNYVATNSFQVEVSGRIYGLNIYDISDYPLWEDVFRVEDSLQLKSNYSSDYTSGVNQSSYSKNYIYNYTAGTNDQYGNTTDRLSKYTFPLVNGSHPYYKNVGVLKKGYAFRFNLDSIGNLYSDACKVIIKPTFWFVDQNGENRTQVDLYYSEDISGSYRELVKVGSSLDLINVKEVETGDVYLGIPKSELKATAALRNTTYKKIVSQLEAMFTFGNIKLNYAFRTFTNQEYTYDTLHSSNASVITAKGIESTDIDIRKQSWYGEWYMPGTALAVKSGYDVYGYASKYGVDSDSPFWLKDGYIIVNFDIYTIDQDGNQRLSYTNASNYLNNNNCCMWVMEGYQLEKTDYNDTTFSFKIGDVMMYSASESVSDDYTVGGTH